MSESSQATTHPGDPVRPLLATPAQIAAERTLLRLLDDPLLAELRAEIRKELADTPRGRSESGAATLDHAVDEWTNSLIMAEIAVHQEIPAIILVTDNTPRTWMGHTVPGIGTSGDNPDAVYRLAVIDGTRRYEVTGRFDMANRPAQVTLELHRGSKVSPPPMDGKKSDLTPLASISDRDLDVAPDGTFRFTIGPNPEGAVHMSSQPGQLTLGFRDMLDDWTQQPCALELHPLDSTPGLHASDADVLQAIQRDLPPYIRFWSGFPEGWFGGLRGNAITPVQGRNGSLSGFIAALSFDLADDQAIVVTTQPNDAAYSGFQILDPWMIGADVTRHQVSLNTAQSRANPDGTVTCVISKSDPGVANWLSTAGLRQGLGIVRWQAVPGEPDVAGFVREFRVVDAAELAQLPDLIRVTPEQRAEQLAARARSYAVRAS
ncbi:hypothetical protein [Nocardia macrotermitis]|uniref:DUF1214 domain-containing protein n=1 Tax=Nocardia macrotermitis TaxID=2585198 RepID=A0A7K0CVL1_9NOCA|nr:hypothetical protein [Nocardia macrotermitis]MQY17536.1 hypothetical protein [Nocardia macrotermitis]